MVDEKDFKLMELEKMLWKDRYEKVVNVLTSLKLFHRFLGTVVITDACVQLQTKNTDPTSIFVEHDGEIKEVSKALLTMI